VRKAELAVFSQEGFPFISGLALSPPILRIDSESEEIPTDHRTE
jgi:hypothetical protein